MTITARQSRSSLLFECSPGELAFDRALRSLFPFVLLCYLPFLLASRSEESPFPPEADWIVFSIGIVAFCFWAWLVRGVAAAWRDPIARVFRFSSSLLLLFFAVIVFSLLRAPLR